MRATREEALALAADALTTAMDFYFEDRRRVPVPSAPKRGQVMVDLPPSVAAKVLLLNEMLRQQVRPAELARRMNVRPQEVNRLTDLHHPTKIDTISLAPASHREKARVEPCLTKAIRGAFAFRPHAEELVGAKG